MREMFVIWLIEGNLRMKRDLIRSMCLIWHPQENTHEKDATKYGNTCLTHHPSGPPASGTLQRFEKLSQVGSFKVLECHMLSDAPVVMFGPAKSDTLEPTIV